MIKVLIGDGGHAREVDSQINNSIDFFVDDEYHTENNKLILPLNLAIKNSTCLDKSEKIAYGVLLELQ